MNNKIPTNSLLNLNGHTTDSDITPVLNSSGSQYLGNIAGVSIEIPTSFGKILAVCQEEMKMNNREFAKFLDISESSLYNYKKESQVPLLQRLEKICEILKVSGSRKEQLIKDLQPKSISIDDEVILLTLIDDGCSISEIQQVFEDLGNPKSKSTIQYHKGRLLKENNPGLTEDTIGIQPDIISSLIDQILDLSKDLKTPKQKNDRLVLGNVFQELAEFIYHFNNSTRAVIPEYALSVTRSTETGEIIHTSNIVDLLVHNRAVEVKLGRADPKQIKKQVLSQLKAIEMRQASGELTKDCLLSGIEGIDVVVMEECDATQALRAELKDYLKVKVITLQDLINQYSSKHDASKYIISSDDGRKRWANLEDYGISATEGLFIDELFSAIRNQKIVGEELEAMRYALHTVNNYRGFERPGLTVDEAEEFVVNHEKAFRELLATDSLTIKKVRVVLQETLGIPESVLDKSNYMICHFEEHGQLKSIQRKFKIREQKSVTQQIEQIWRRLGYSEDFILNVENLHFLVKELQKITKKVPLESNDKVSTNFIDYESFQRSSLDLVALLKVGQEADLAKDLLLLEKKQRELILENLFISNNSRFSFVKILPLYLSLYNIKKQEVYNLVKEIRQSSAGKKSFWGALLEIPKIFKHSATAINLRRYLNNISTASTDNLSAFFEHEVERTIASIDKSINYFESVSPDLNSIVKVRRKIVKAYESRAQRVDNVREATALFVLETKCIHKFLLYTLKSIIQRAKAISNLDIELARDYIYSTTGIRPSGVALPYHRFLPPRGNDPLYEAITHVAKHLSDRDTYEAVGKVSAGQIITFQNLVHLHLLAPNIYKAFLSNARNGNLNKVHAIIGLQPADMQHLKKIETVLANNPDEYFAEIELGRPLFSQI